MGKRGAPEVYSIAAHRGFADALVAGLVPRYTEGELGLARLTLLVPSTRAARTISEAFVRHSGEAGVLMPRMVAIGDLDLDEALGSLLDPLGAEDIPPAIEPTRRWLELSEIVAAEMAKLGKPPLHAAARLRIARELAQTMDRLLVEEKTPEDLIDGKILDLTPNLAKHWEDAILLFARVQAKWRFRLDARGEVDAATRRNMLFDRASAHWRADPPRTPIVAAGVTSAAPALARMLRVISELPKGAVILPDLDLSMGDAAWDELGSAGASDDPDGETFAKGDALTHPQYHLKLLLNRMGVNRAEVRQWHRKGDTAAPSARSHAISSLFLPPESSKLWVGLPSEKRRLSGVRLLTSATSDEEAQAIALMVREVLEVPEKRVAVVTADRSLARRVVQHLARWNITADDSAGRPLTLTPAGRFFGLLTEIASKGFDLPSLIGALAHPLVQAETPEARRDWLAQLRLFDRELRGPAPTPGPEPLRAIAGKADVAEWWKHVEETLAPLTTMAEITLADALDALVTTGEALAGEALWSREDGRALAATVEDLRLHARDVGTMLEPADLAGVLRDAMDEVAVRPPYGGHPRVAIYGLLESRMARADLVICSGLNEGTWPQPPTPDSILAPAVLRAMGVPGAEFRIGLSAHDLAGAMGAPEVVLSRAQRDKDGPTIPSRFLLRVEALLGEKLTVEHTEVAIPKILPVLDRDVPAAEPYKQPKPMPSAKQRKVRISATALDRLLGDPYQFYAKEILRLKRLDPLAADPFTDAALRGTLVHEILDKWHKARVGKPNLAIKPFAEKYLREQQVHPLFWGLWCPRIFDALEWFEGMIDTEAKAGRSVLVTEVFGSMEVEGIEVFGKPDRIDRMPDGSLGIVDYKTGKPPSAAQVEKGFALQLGVLGLIARDGAFMKDQARISGEVSTYEYWSLSRRKDKMGFGFIDVPMKVGDKRTGLTPESFLPTHEKYLHEAIARYINGNEPFTAKENPNYPGYDEYDQLMRLSEWMVHHISADGKGEA